MNNPSRRSCVFREFVDHTIVHVMLSPVLDDYGTISSMFEGKSVTVDNRGVALVSDRLEFHVEGRELVVYRESVSWCDKEPMLEAMGDDNCPKPKKRTLTELERLGL